MLGNIRAPGPSRLRDRDKKKKNTKKFQGKIYRKISKRLRLF